MASVPDQVSVVDVSSSVDIEAKFALKSDVLSVLVQPDDLLRSLSLEWLDHSH